jgi:hypothetical protein
MISNHNGSYKKKVLLQPNIRLDSDAHPSSLEILNFTLSDLEAYFGGSVDPFESRRGYLA